MSQQYNIIVKDSLKVWRHNVAKQAIYMQICKYKIVTTIIWASSQENLSSEFAVW